jgi:hypothetical protein
VRTLRSRLQFWPERCWPRTLRIVFRSIRPALCMRGWESCARVAVGLGPLQLSSMATCRRLFGRMLSLSCCFCWVCRSGFAATAARYATSTSSGPGFPGGLWRGSWALPLASALRGTCFESRDATGSASLNELHHPGSRRLP